ncbi:copper transporter [Demequina pelophila]|uniref:copper transporter n=1 Tax=Demequina pelophila TaxID=1638984 RepID=UPI0007829668|nr:copper transporter [Demequina pelophila]
MSDRRALALGGAVGIAALAFGVLLGSGPLRTSLLGGSSDTIAGLQADLDAATAAGDAAQAAADASEGYLDGVAPYLLSGVLTDRRVALVTGPDAPADDAMRAGLEARIVDAWGELAGVVSMSAEWSDTATAPFREALAGQVAGSLVGVDDATATAVLAHAFVQGATGAAPTGADRADVDAAGTDRGAVVWDLLAQADLVAGESLSAVDAVVVVADGSEALGSVVEALVAYDAPVTVVGAAADVADYQDRDDLATVAGDALVAPISGAATVAETLAGALPHYRDGDVPARLGTSDAASGTVG